jgi:tetratricopeptide (TPR) repeat protein
MLCKDGGVKIFDFGIAHAGDHNVTGTGQLIGTLKYMAPEQVNSKTGDSRVDIFSTGVVLYQLITSHLPFEGENTAATILKIVHEPPPPLCNFLAAYPPEIEPILLRAMAKNPDDRYASADEFALDLEHLVGQLKEELIDREMQGVGPLLDRGEFYEARRLLLRVLTVDHQHSSAVRQLREVQQRILQYEIEQKALELRQLAEKALAGGQYEEAQEHVDRALTLTRDDLGLKQLREDIRSEASRAEKLYSALNTAQTAQAEGDLDAARKAAEEALALEPENAQAKTLSRLISREVEERSRQHQMEGYLKEASQEISSRRFTVALEILKRAQQLHPAAAQVRSLIASAIAGQEQERRRSESQASGHEIKDALNCDDHRSASEKADPSHAQLEIGSDGLNEDRLRIIERQLAAFIGPLAKVLVKRAAAKTTSTLELYAALAADLEREDDRRAFLAKRTELEVGNPGVCSKQVSAEAAPVPALPGAASSSQEITPAAVERAAHLLAAHLGPIATVLARKEAKRAANLGSFYVLLAEHVAEPAERERFLKMAGIQKDSTIRSSVTPT